MSPDPHPDVRAAAETVHLEPTLIVLFGGTGDLARRKLLPAIYQLMARRNFDDETLVLGVATSDRSDDQYRSEIVDALAEAGIDRADATAWARRTLYYETIDDGIEPVEKRVAELEAMAGLGGNRLFYLAIPPSVFDDTVEALGDSVLCRGAGWTRVVVEKPFGIDQPSAEHLNELLHRYYDESQIYRIDHYLAKEMVQNLLVFRFANPLFEQSWNRDRIESIQITVAETLGLEGRAGYFDRSGIIRDIVQNHLLQLLTLVAMEPPVRMNSTAIRDEKVKVLQSMYPVDEAAVVRGRYVEGQVGDEKVIGYLDEDGVAEDSSTETFAALKLEIDNWRWRGVPFYVQAGKRLADRLTEVVVTFKEPPVCLFGDEDGSCETHANVLFMTLQPNEGFDLKFDVKTPGEEMVLASQRLSFRYGEVFGELPRAYETLLADVMAGDQTLFVRADEAEHAWRILSPALDLSDQPQPYAAGSWGPHGARRLLERNGHRWERRTQGSR